MIAVDANALLRCLTLDDPQQVPYAKALDFADARHLVASTADEACLPT
jgi:hypothetical protein